MTKRADNRVWKALADPSRRAMLELLRERPRTTGELCSRFGRLSRFAVMKHLRLLEQTLLVRSKKQGRYRWNYLDPRPLAEIERTWFKRVARAG